MKSYFHLVMLTLLFALSSVCQNLHAAFPQENKAKEPTESKQEDNSSEEKLATIKGSLVLESDIVKQIDWRSMQGSLGQLVAMQQPEFPRDWQTMTVEDRRAWLTKFFVSEEGKKLQASNQQKLLDRHQQEFPIRDNGKFVVYDVPQGRFEMRIFAQTEVEGKTWIVQSYGQFEVGDVDEVDFSGMPLDVLRLLTMGEEAPEVSGKTTAGKNIALSDFRGKHVLMVFGLTASPAFKVTTESLTAAAQSKENAGKLTLLTVTVDDDLETVAKFNEQNGVDWPCLNLGRWDQTTLNNFGLKSVPSFWLLDPEGKIVLTGQQFVIELNRNQCTIAKLVDDAIAGRLVIGGEEEEEAGIEGQSDDTAPGGRNDG